MSDFKKGDEVILLDSSPPKEATFIRYESRTKAEVRETETGRKRVVRVFSVRKCLPKVDYDQAVEVIEHRANGVSFVRVKDSNGSVTEVLCRTSDLKMVPPTDPANG